MSVCKDCTYLSYPMNFRFQTIQNCIHGCSATNINICLYNNIVCVFTNTISGKFLPYVAVKLLI
jgi:hypothetical protein